MFSLSLPTEKYPLLDSMKIKQTTCLDKRILIPANIRIIGQANNQLILCLLIQEKLLLVFDQHAVHERIRYERLLADAFDGPQLAIRKIVPPIVYTISESQLSDLASKQSELENYFRLKFKPTSSAAIQVSQLPSCFKQYANQQLFDEFIIETLRLLSTEQTPKSNYFTFLLLRLFFVISYFFFLQFAYRDHFCWNKSRHKPVVVRFVSTSHFHETIAAS